MLQNLKWTSYSIVHLEDRSDLYIWRPYLISTSCLVDKYGRGWFFHWKFCIKCVYVMWIMPDGGGEERKLPSVLLSASEFYKQWRHHTWWWLGPAGPAGEAQYSTGSAQNTVAAPKQQQRPMCSDLTQADQRKQLVKAQTLIRYQWRPHLQHSWVDSHLCKITTDLRKCLQTRKLQNGSA